MARAASTKPAKSKNNALRHPGNAGWPDRLAVLFSVFSSESVSIEGAAVFAFVPALERGRP